MSDEHAPTEQETAIYDALTEGDHATVVQLHEDAYTADQTPPDPIPEDWLSPIDQFDTDYLNGWNHYQADHEPPEQAREAATQTHVTNQNDAAEDANAGN